MSTLANKTLSNGVGKLYKNERQVVALILGCVILLMGLLVILGLLSSTWIIEEMPVNILKLIGGGFITLIGTIIFLSGVSEASWKACQIS